MSLTVTNGYGPARADYSSTNVESNENVVLFDDTTLDELTNVDAQLAKLESELADLKLQRQEKVDYKKELERQKALLLSQKAALEAQIKANEEAIKQNNAVIKNNEEKIVIAQKEIEELEKKYEIKNSEAMNLNEKINDKIAQIIKGSEENLKEQQEKVKAATDEAYAKVASGEITQDEVAQYIKNKVGGNISGTNEDFSVIYSMNQQLRTLTEEARGLCNNISAKNTLIINCQANIANAIAANQDLAKANAPLNKQLGDINKQVVDIDKEITFVNQEIAQYDAKIANKEMEISDYKNQTVSEDVKNDIPVNNPQDVVNVPSEEVPVAQCTTEVESSNPFLTISYNTGEFANMVDALDAMHKANEQSIQNAKTVVDGNNIAVKNLFTFA